MTLELNTTAKQYYKSIINQALKEAGGRTALAEYLQCSPTRISEWKKGNIEMGGFKLTMMIVLIIEKHKERNEIPKIIFGENEIELQNLN